MLRLAESHKEITVINDQISSPTYALDLAEVIMIIVSNQILGYGVYHYSNEGEISWYDFAKEIFNQSKFNTKITPISTEKYFGNAKRPLYSLLDNKKIKEIATEQEFILAVAEKEMEFEKAKRKAEIVDNSRSENDRKKSEIDFTVAKNDLFLSQENLNFHKKNSILNLKLAQGKVARLTVEVDDFNRDIERLKVKAPMDGMVIYKANWEGEKPAVGESVQFGQPILELAVIEHMQLKAQVAEPDSGKLVLGQKVKIILDGTQEQIFSGKVVNLGRVFRSKSAQDKKRILDTIIEFDKTNSSVMRPGMTARIEVITKVLDKALTLPLEAVKGAADSKVITLESGLDKPVEVAHIIGNKVVLAKGVKQGDLSLIHI